MTRKEVSPDHAGTPQKWLKVLMSLWGGGAQAGERDNLQQCPSHTRFTKMAALAVSG